MAHCWKKGQVLSHSSPQSQHLPHNCKLNPTSLPPDPDWAALIHDCAEITDEVYYSGIDLQDQPQPLEEADWTLYEDGSSYMDKGNRKAGYAIAIVEGIVEVKALPLGTSAQKAELIALRRALELSQEKRVNVYIDSRCAFLILQSHGSTWKEKESLTSNKKEIKHAAEILKLLEAVQVPLQVAVTHCLGHQKRTLKWLEETIWLTEQRKRLLKEHL